MIAQVDDALRNLVRSEALEGGDIDVLFDAPTKDWAARRNAPTVNLYLYDIREDLRRRERGWVDVLDADGAVQARRPPPRFFKLSYLVTAWTQRAEDEHRLLSALLTCFLRHDALPDQLVTGPLRDAHAEVEITVGYPPPEDRAFADVWSALGGELKPSLDVVVIAPVPIEPVEPLAAIATAGLHVDAADTVHGGADTGVHRRVAPVTDGIARRRRR